MWLNAFYALYQMMFNLAHLMLADKYSKISINAPRRLEGKEEIPETDCDRRTFWALFTFMAIIPILYAVTIIVFWSNVKIYNRQT